MKQLREKQQGITMAGLIVVLGFISCLVLFGVRAFPLYNEKFQIISAMTTVASEAGADKLSAKELQKAFLKNIQVTSNINRFTQRNVKDYVELVKPKAAGEPKMMRVHYQATNKLFADLQLLLDFDRELPLASGGKAG